MCSVTVAGIGRCLVAKEVNGQEKKGSVHFICWSTVDYKTVDILSVPRGSYSPARGGSTLFNYTRVYPTQSWNPIGRALPLVLRGRPLIGEARVLGGPVTILYLIIKIPPRANPAQSWNRIGRALPLVVGQAADRLEFGLCVGQLVLPELGLSNDD